MRDYTKEQRDYALAVLAEVTKLQSPRVTNIKADSEGETREVEVVGYRAGCRITIVASIDGSEQ